MTKTKLSSIILLLFVSNSFFFFLALFLHISFLYYLSQLFLPIYLYISFSPTVSIPCWCWSTKTSLLSIPSTLMITSVLTVSFSAATRCTISQEYEEADNFADVTDLMSGIGARKDIVYRVRKSCLAKLASFHSWVKFGYTR